MRSSRTSFAENLVEVAAQVELAENCYLHGDEEDEGDDGGSEVDHGLQHRQLQVVVEAGGGKGQVHQQPQGTHQQLQPRETYKTCMKHTKDA